MKTPMRVAVTGGAGQIAYSLLFRIASGEMLGSDQPVYLQLLEIAPALNALKGVVMELNDCAYPLLQGVSISDDPNVAFKDADVAMLVGARPRSKGMERGDLLAENGKIFGPQGRALNEHASRDVKVLAIGNPANTNCLIAMNNAPDLNRNQFTAMMRLDHNRSISQLAEKTASAVSAIAKVTVWGNHSATQYPDFYNAKIGGKPVVDVIDDEAWLKGEFIATVQQRGAAIIKARGASSAASAANAAIDTVKSIITPTAEGDWNSVCVCSDGSYDTEPGLITSFPVRSDGASWEIVQDVPVNEFGREKIDTTVAELSSERGLVSDLL